MMFQPIGRSTHTLYCVDFWWSGGPAAVRMRAVCPPVNATCMSTCVPTQQPFTRLLYCKSAIHSSKVESKVEGFENGET